jgi:hypothetical protein
MREPLGSLIAEHKMKRTQNLFGVTVLGAGVAGAAFGQTGPPYDPQQLPVLQGRVAIVGHRDPPHQRNCARLQSVNGDAIAGLDREDELRAEMRRQMDLGSVIEDQPVDIAGWREAVLTTRATVTDNGPGGPAGPREREEPLTALGHVKAQLRGPRGDLHGVVLEDGTIVRLPPDEADRLAAQLAPGLPLYVEGEG